MHINVNAILIGIALVLAIIALLIYIIPHFRA